MKIKGEKFDTIAAGMKATVESLGGPVAVKAEQAKAGWNDNALLWKLWHIASRSIQYDDAHPAFAAGHWTRVVPQVPGFDIYSEGINDEHILTALRKIGKEIGAI